MTTTVYTRGQRGLRPSRQHSGHARLVALREDGPDHLQVRAQSGSAGTKDLPAGIGTVGGMTCAARAALIERRNNRLDSVRTSVNFATERAHIPYAGGIHDCGPQTWPSRAMENA
jgi:hypothetical protein